MPPPPARVEEAITSRHSIRAFLPTPVPRATIEEILAVAARAPSGTNTQPWHVDVLTGEALRGAVGARLVAAYDDPVERAAPQRGVRLLPDRVALALHRAPAQGRLGPVRPARHRQDRQGAHARAAPAQLRVLRRAGRPHVHDRPRHAPGQLARLRHVPAERDGRGARLRPRHLPAGGVHAVPPHHHRGDRRAGRTSSSSAACRSATPTPTRSRTRSSPSASRSRASPASSTERRHATACLDPGLPPHLPRRRRAPARALRGRGQRRRRRLEPRRADPPPAGQGRRLRHRHAADRRGAARRLPAAARGRAAWRSATTTSTSPACTARGVARHQRARRADRDDRRLRLRADDGGGAAHQPRASISCAAASGRSGASTCSPAATCTARRSASSAWAGSARRSPAAARTASRCR